MGSPTSLGPSPTPMSTEEITLPREQRRVTDDVLRRVMERLRQSGELSVLLGDIQDRMDAFALRQLSSMNLMLYTPEGIAKLQAWQAARAELGILLQRWADASKPLPKAPPERQPLASEDRSA